MLPLLQNYRKSIDDFVASYQTVGTATTALGAAGARIVTMEDLAQDVFVKAYLNLGALRNGAVFKSWLHRITANTCIDWLRHNKTESGMAFNLKKAVLKGDC